MLPSVWLGNPIADSPHVPVLQREVVAWLDIEPGMTLVDGTFGAGGHSELLAEAMDGRGRHIAIDRDRTVRRFHASFAQRHPRLNCELRVGSFADELERLVEEGLHADAILLDLGVSSMQIDDLQRGFSYASDAPLDMRMDPDSPRTAADLLAELPEAELARIFDVYGEERYARPIARAIVRRRAKAPFLRSNDLVDVVKRSIPTPALFGQGHPAKRVFQALRIAVNDELGQVERALDAIIELLAPGGRAVVISFHSLEDRLVKNAFREAARGCICPPDLPVCGCGREPELRVLTPRVVRPGDDEMAANPRSASARLRVAERVGG